MNILLHFLTCFGTQKYDECSSTLRTDETELQPVKPSKSDEICQQNLESTSEGENRQVLNVEHKKDQELAEISHINTVESNPQEPKLSDEKYQYRKSKCLESSGTSPKPATSNVRTDEADDPTDFTLNCQQKTITFWYWCIQISIVFFAILFSSVMIWYYFACLNSPERPILRTFKSNAFPNPFICLGKTFEKGE